jgi:hypothetical protein
MEEEKKELSFYNRYKDSIIASRKRWFEKSENKAKHKESTQYRIQLYKSSYYKLLDLVEKNVIDKSVIDDLRNETKNKCEELRKISST